MWWEKYIHTSFARDRALGRSDRDGVAITKYASGQATDSTDLCTDLVGVAVK